MWLWDWFWDVLSSLGEPLNVVVVCILLTGSCFRLTKVWRTRTLKSFSLALIMLEKLFVHNMFPKLVSVLTIVLETITDAAAHAEE
jgi:hypothetical protein